MIVTNNKRIFSFILLLSGISFLVMFSSCTVSSVELDVLVPAEINIPKEIKHVGIANRSLPAEGRQIMDLVEGFISGESILADRFGSEHCLKGLAETLNNSPRFSAVIIQGENLRGTGTRMFPKSLPWREVERICRKYRVDSLIALETFDSNIHLDKDKRMVKRQVEDEDTGKKREIRVPEYHLTLNIQVNSGWKIYDPYKRSVLDVDTYTDNKSWIAAGETQKGALAGLPNKRDAINQAGYFSGVQYGIRISPTWLHVSRYYYVKGSPGFKDARGYVRTGNWKQATIIWRRLVDIQDRKIAGRAAYNLAVAAEVSGELKNALEWARRSSIDFGNRKAYRYMRILETRIRDRERLREQLD